MNSNALRDWFEGLAPRERLLVLAAAGLAVVAVLVVGVVRPLLAARAAAEADLADGQRLLNDIEGVARRYGPQTSRPLAAAGGSDSLVVVVDRTTRERGLAAYLKRNQPEGAAGIRLRFENVPFDELLQWLGEIQQREGLRASAASFDPAGEPGRVNSNLVLGRSAG